MNTHFPWFDEHRQSGDGATGAIARFSGSLAALLLLAECSLRRRRALPGSRKNAPSHLSN